MIRKIFSALGPLLLVGAGFVVIGVMFATRPQAEQKEPQKRIPTVQVAKMAPENPQVSFTAVGRVIPAQMVRINPQVTGKIVSISKNLQPGGHFRKGDFLAQIEKRDYQLALGQSRANAESAGLQLTIDKAQQSVAQKDWSQTELNRLGDANARALALKEPQVQRAQMAFTAAENAVKQAELALARTTLMAPFNAVVQSENIDVGQVVGPSSPVATLVGTDTFWVQAALPVSSLNRLAIPGLNAEKGSEVTVTHSAENNVTIKKSGHIIRYLGELDGTGHMAQILVEIPDPLGLKSKSELPLLTGARVTVAFAGKSIEGIYKIPRMAVRENDSVFILSTENRLLKKEIETVWRDENDIWTRSLSSGDQLITSPIALPVEGMQLQADKKSKGN